MAWGRGGVKGTTKVEGKAYNTENLGPAADWQTQTSEKEERC